MNKKRIGIFSGTFDPIHAGHIAFALQALKSAKLDHIVLLPERRPRNKPGVEHFGHRAAMITRAIKPHANFELLELPDIHFDVSHTLPKLKKTFPSSQLVLLMGAEVAIQLPSWPDASKLLESCELVVGLREGQQKSSVTQTFKAAKLNVRQLVCLESAAPQVKSSTIREALRRKRPTHGLLASVRKYAEKQWLYASLSKE